MPAMTSGSRIDQTYPSAEVEYRTRRSRTVSSQREWRYRSTGDQAGREGASADTLTIVGSRACWVRSHGTCGDQNLGTDTASQCVDRVDDAVQGNFVDPAGRLIETLGHGLDDGVEVFREVGDGAGDLALRCYEWGQGKLHRPFVERNHNESTAGRQASQSR